MLQILKQECVLSQTVIKINWSKKAGLSETSSSGIYEQMKRKFADVFQTLETNENGKKYK